MRPSAAAQLGLSLGERFVANAIADVGQPGRSDPSKAIVRCARKRPVSAGRNVKTAR